jgi:hypothetical protein
MANNINNYGLGGVAGNLQLGKQGPRLVSDASGVELRDSANSVLVNLKVANAVLATDAVTLSQLTSVANSVTVLSNTITATVGQSIPLGAYSGSYLGAVTFLNSVSVSNAIESLNSILGHLVPTAPTSYPTGGFTLGSTGSSPLLAANGVADRTAGASGLTPGSSVTRLISSTVTTNTITLNNQSSNGLAADLTLTLLINNATSTTYSFTDVTASGSSDVGNHAGILIAAQAAFPSATPGFWKSFSVGVSGALSLQGINSLKLNSSNQGNSNILYWVQDNLNTAPTVSGPSMTLAANGTVAYSSAVPHFNTGGSVTGNFSISNLSGETYYGGTPIAISGSNGVIGAQTFSYATAGIATPIARQTTAATAVTPLTISVNPSNAFAVGTLSVTATTVSGTGSTALSATNLLVKTGSYSAVDELNIPVSLLGSLPNGNNALRVAVTADASGVDTPTSAANTAWSSTAALPIHAAGVVAGVLTCNKTNYSTGYLPVGPDYSGHDNAQYATFSFQRSSVSAFIINVTGSYTHCWIALPGVSDNSSISPNAKSGVWWDTAVAYNGVGVPGDASNPNAGCAFNAGSLMSGAGGAFTMTFGTQSSTNATGSTILVRFKLATGQAVTALSFT